jgi:hypothetical protein
MVAKPSSAFDPVAAAFDNAQMLGPDDMTPEQIEILEAAVRERLAEMDADATRTPQEEAMRLARKHFGVE